MEKILLVITTALIIASCDPVTNNPGNDPWEDPNVALAEGDIGSSGGFLEADGITLTVPPGSFSSPVTIQLFPGDESMNSFGDNMVTGLYQIEGIPEDFTKPIEIRLAYSGTLANENYLVVGNEYEVIESDEPSYNTALYEAKDSSGFLVSSIEPPVAPLSSNGNVKKGTSSVYSNFVLTAISRMSSLETPYFRFIHQLKADRQKIKLLADHMDAAIDTFSSINLIGKSYAEAAIKEFGKPNVTIWGRNNERYRGWNIDMPEFEMQTENIPPSYGAYIWQTLLQIKFSLSENVLRVFSENQIAGLAYAAVYRMCCFSRVGSRQDWFTYGSTLWIQEKYSGLAEYKVTASPLFAMSPLVGMESGKTRFSNTQKTKTNYGGILTPQEGNYGHSMVPLIKYLDLTYAKDKSQTVRILAETILSKSRTATECIINAVEDPEYIWLPGFYKAYLTRKLYNIPWVNFQDEIQSLDYLNFYKAVDTIMYNEADYADLSARFHKVNFLMDEFKEDATLNLKLGPPSRNLDYLTTMTFGLKNDELEYFDHSSDLTITNLSDLFQNGYRSIVALVINSANEPPFDETLKIELETELKIAPKEFDWVILKVMALSNFTFTVGGSGINEVVYADAKLRTGKMTGNKFTATWSEPLSDGTSSGTIDIVFDPERFPRYITSYSVTETQKLSSTRTYTIAGDNLEFWGYRDIQGTYVYYIKGAAVKDYISFINEEYTGSDGYGYSTDGIPLTQDNSYIEIRMGTFEP